MRTRWMRWAAGVAPAALVLAACSAEPSCIALPLEPGTFRPTSPYGPRIDPIRGTESMHYGADFGALLGTPIYAVADGEVVYAGAGRQGRSSELVVVAHEVGGETFYSWYVHMYPDGVFVEVGDRVRAGQQIAEVGNNGNSTGPHLHLEIHTTDTELDLGLATTVPGRAALGPDLPATGEGVTADLRSLPIPTLAATDPDPGEVGPDPEPTPTPTPTETTTPDPTPSETATPDPTPTETTTPDPTPSEPESPTAPETDEPTSPAPSHSPGQTESPRPFPDRAFGTTVDPLPFLESLGDEPVGPSVCRGG